MCCSFSYHFNCTCSGLSLWRISPSHTIASFPFLSETYNIPNMFRKHYILFEESEPFPLLQHTFGIHVYSYMPQRIYRNWLSDCFPVAAVMFTTFCHWHYIASAVASFIPPLFFYTRRSCFFSFFTELTLAFRLFVYLLLDSYLDIRYYYLNMFADFIISNARARARLFSTVVFIAVLCICIIYTRSDVCFVPYQTNKILLNVINISV